MNPYTVGTVIARTEPHADPRDILEVVGASKTKTPSVGDWVGAGGEAIIVRPHEEFGETFELALGQAQAQYEILSQPPALGEVVAVAQVDPRTLPTAEELIALGANPVGANDLPPEEPEVEVVAVPVKVKAKR